MVAPATVEAQSLDVGDQREAYLRLLQIGGVGDPGSFTVRPLSIVQARTAASASGHPWSGRRDLDVNGRDGPVAWTVGDAGVRLFVNSHHPRGQNDGAVWQGKGATTALDTRASVEWGPLSVTVNPLVIHNQNAAFDLAPVLDGSQPEYAYPWWVLDYPQRFGPDAFWTLDLGQSQIALDWKGFRASFGNESLWWGPGTRNAIVMSGNAPGFPHAALGTHRPVDIGIGTLEGRWIWGGLRQSDWFRPADEADRYTTGIVLAYAPSFVPGLTVGGTRMFQLYVPESGLDFSEYFLVFQGLLKSGQVSEEAPDGTDIRDQLLSLFARWSFPESGFEAYFEWARNDHAWDLQDLLLEPEHSQAYTVGFQKVMTLSSERMFAFGAELTHLEAPPTFQLRPRGVYYLHTVVTQGYTHEGQILGAGVGPGGNAQSVSADLFEPWGRAGLFLQRQVHDNDAFWVWADENDASFDRHNVSIDVGAHATVFVREFEFGGGLTYTRELNRYFFGPKVNNFNVALSARWRPRGR